MAFSQRRKTLLNSLKAGLPLSGEQIQQALTLAGIDGQRRAETLEVAEFALRPVFLPDC